MGGTSCIIIGFSFSTDLGCEYYFAKLKDAAEVSL